MQTGRPAPRECGKKLAKRPLRRVLFRLAGHLGMTVGEIEERMSSTELAEWVALIRLDPWGYYRSDLQHALAAWAPMAAWSKGAKVTDFLPRDLCAEMQAESTTLTALVETGAKVMTREQAYG